MKYPANSFIMKQLPHALIGVFGFSRPQPIHGLLCMPYNVLHSDDKYWRLGDGIKQVAPKNITADEMQSIVNQLQGEQTVAPTLAHSLTEAVVARLAWERIPTAQFMNDSEVPQ